MPGRAAILEAALRLFAELGFDGVSMRTVADAAGVSKANIYHHFASKQALHVAVLQSSVAQTRQLFEALSADHEPVDVRLARFIKAHLAHMFDNHLNYRLMLREALEDDPVRVRALADEVARENFQRLVAVARDGQATGDLRAEVDPALFAALLVGANVFFFQTRNVLDAIGGVRFAADPARFAEGVTDLLLNGMRTAPRSTPTEDKA